MKPAISERLADLIRAAAHLQAIIEAETPATPLPTFALCRCAVDVDAAIGHLEKHAERLAG